MGERHGGRIWALLTVALMVIFAAGCAHAPASSRVVRIAVIDGQPSVTEQALTGKVERKGWWFSARDYYRPPTASTLLADAVAERLSKADGLEVYSREDLSIYMATKERLLRRNFPKLTSEDRKKVLAEQSPIDYGKSLNVDYVVRPQIFRSSTVTNRFVSWWYSHLKASVEVWDVQTGQLVWTYPFDDADAFDSLQAMSEECARQAASKAKSRHVFVR